MAKDKKPSEEQIQKLHSGFTDVFQKVFILNLYHNRRMHFFKKWNLRLKIFDAFVGIGGLVLICLHDGDNISFIVAGIAVFLLFLTVILDFSKKEETHRWLASSYMNFEKTITSINVEDWKNFSQEDYEKNKKILFDITETINSLRKEEFPILNFLHFLCQTAQEQGGEKDVSIVFHVKWWQNFLADYSPMPDSLTKLIEKFKRDKTNKDKEENPS